MGLYLLQFNTGMRFICTLKIQAKSGLMLCEEQPELYTTFYRVYRELISALIWRQCDSITLALS